MPASSRTGSSTPLESIYRAHYGLVRWVLRARGVPEASLDDRVHDAFLAIFRRLPDRDPAVPLRTWIAGVARNVGFSHRRAAARRRRRDETVEAPAPPRRPDEELERREAWDALGEFLEQLRPEQREVFVMVELSGMRVSELATAMGMPANTLHSRLQAARRRFARRFESHTDLGGLVRHARRQARPRPEQRRRTWALIVASTRGAALPTSLIAAPTTSWVASAKLTAATVVIGLLGAAGVVAIAGSEAPPAPATSRDTSDREPDETKARTDPALPQHTAAEPAAVVPNPASEPPATEEPARASRRRAAETSPDEPSPAVDTKLLATLEVLRRARRSLARDRPAEALATLRELGGPVGELERERRRLELDAACRLDDQEVARRAAAALGELGVSTGSDDPCEASDE